MTNSGNILKLTIRVLLIIAAVLAVSSLAMNYGIAEKSPLSPKYLPWQDEIGGSELSTPYTALIWQLVLSGLLMFLTGKKLVKVVVTILTLFQLLFVVFVVNLETGATWYFSPYKYMYIGWGFCLLILASLMLLLCCILNFFAKPAKVANPELLDENL